MEKCSHFFSYDWICFVSQGFHIDKFLLSLKRFKYHFAKLALRLLSAWTLSGRGTNRASWGSIVPFCRFSFISVIAFLLPSSQSIMQARTAPLHFFPASVHFCTFVRKGLIVLTGLHDSCSSQIELLLKPL